MTTQKNGFFVRRGHKNSSAAHDYAVFMRGGL
jgi:hypothetical protein